MAQAPLKLPSPQILCQHLPLIRLWHCQAEVIIWAKLQGLDQNPTSVVLLGRQAVSDMQDAPVGLPALGRMAGVDPPPIQILLLNTPRAGPSTSQRDLANKLPTYRA